MLYGWLLLPLILISWWWNIRHKNHTILGNTNPRKYNVCYIPKKKKNKKSTRVYLTSFRVVKPWIHVILRSSYFIISEQLHYQYLLEKLCMYINLVADFFFFPYFFLSGVLDIIYENKRDDEIRKKKIK